MKKSLLFLSALALSTIMTMPVIAGEWVPNPSYSNLWSYIKDDGTYANAEWIKDNTGTWYWITEGSVGYLSTVQGIAPDGYRYNAKGEYIDMNADGRKYMTQQLFAKIRIGMSYEDVIAILGKEHEISKSSSTSLTIKFFSEDPSRYVSIYFINGRVASAFNWLN